MAIISPPPPPPPPSPSPSPAYDVENPIGLRAATSIGHANQRRPEPRATLSALRGMCECSGTRHVSRSEDCHIAALGLACVLLSAAVGGAVDGVHGAAVGGVLGAALYGAAMIVTSTCAATGSVG